MRNQWQTLARWLTPGIGVKRWLFMLIIGIISLSVGGAILLSSLYPDLTAPPPIQEAWPVILIALVTGITLTIIGLFKLSRNILQPYRRYQQGKLVDIVYTHTQQRKGMKIVAIGGGTGLPATLRALKPYTGNITAVVTVADNGGSSGRLRRDLGILPPGDLRNNIAALADDESLMTQLFQYRFDTGDLGGHAFGNLFITALAGVTGSLESALIETERVLNIQGRVLPATLEDISLIATIQTTPNAHPITVHGESQISETGGHIQHIKISPEKATAYDQSIQAILEAEWVIIGPGSLYTSLLPNLLVEGIANALRATNAHKIYVCNVATQPGETDNYNVADHILAIENHIGRGVFSTVVANDTYPTLNAGDKTHYVSPAPPNHELFQRYDIHYSDLTDPERPWRHSPEKLAQAILSLGEKEKVRGLGVKNHFPESTKAVIM